MKNQSLQFYHISVAYENFSDFLKRNAVGEKNILTVWGNHCKRTAKKIIAKNDKCKEAKMNEQTNE